MNIEDDHEPGELAFRARFADVPHVANSWDDQPESVRVNWRRVEDAITERAVNQRHRLQVEVVEAVEERAEPAYVPPHGSWHLGESFGFHRGRLTSDIVAATALDHMVPVLEPDLPRPAPAAAPALPKLSGNACPKCKNFTMVRTGKCETCQICGDTGGCG